MFELFHKHYMIINESTFIKITEQERVEIEHAKKILPQLAKQIILVLRFDVQYLNNNPHLTQKINKGMMVFNDMGVMISPRNGNIPNLGPHKKRQLIWDRFYNNAYFRRITERTLDLIQQDIYSHKINVENNLHTQHTLLNKAY